MTSQSPALPSDLLAALLCREPLLWLNHRWASVAATANHFRDHEPSLGLADVLAADQDLRSFAPLLATIFPQELAATEGVIESPLIPVPNLQKQWMGSDDSTGPWYIKADHALPVAGSIKARGGIYEVLLHAEDLAHKEEVLGPGDGRIELASSQARKLFAQHRVAVGSTGNLGLSIGIMAAALGFKATVHMSSEAKPWKKDRLRNRGVQVIEHEGDFEAAVAAGRHQAAADESTYFVDDENSIRLFLGYAAAAVRLRRQLTEQHIAVDAQHPLFVYLPCGVGGAPGGITFGLRHLLGDHVHCFFAEPVSYPCMLVRLASQEDRRISVRDIGLHTPTEADGLAVARASELVVQHARTLISGIFTVTDEDLFRALYWLKASEDICVEPSATAGFYGPQWLITSEAGQRYAAHHQVEPYLSSATHILWTTGGLFMPGEEYRRFYERGSLRDYL